VVAQDVLVGAQDRVRRGWCQHEVAVSGRHGAVEPTDPDADAWSLLGAIVAASDAPTAIAAGALAISDLALAMGALAQVIEEPSLARWNDASDRTQAEVVETLSEAIALLDAAAVDLQVRVAS
jgi:hypothetical protein